MKPQYPLPERILRTIALLIGWPVVLFLCIMMAIGSTSWGLVTSIAEVWQ